ncbi:hypothetical protein L1885_20560 [Streptomyces fuscigenes]|nr:hypothetical protein [Streptomyces fuscigenes]MCF3964011.1 hypothetical protein [Streptomyces fuscigenes]
MLRADPRVSDRVKSSLRPCGSDSYPVNTSYGDLTGGSQPDIVINVTTCKDSIGIGTYVYRVADSASASPGARASGSAADRTAAAGTTAPGGAYSAVGTSLTSSPSASQDPFAGVAGDDDAAEGGLLDGDAPAPGKELPGRYENVFSAEEPAVYGTIDRGELVVTQQVYTKGDSAAYPSGEDVITYDWSKSKFTVRFRVRNTYSKTDGNDDLGAPVPTVTASG